DAVLWIDAVRNATDSRGAIPADQRRRTNGVPQRARAQVHLLEGHLRRLHVQLQSRPVRKARAVRPPGDVRPADHDVLDVLQVAVAARSTPGLWLPAGAAGRGVSRPRVVRRMGTLPKGPTKFLVLRHVDVHGVDSTHHLFELQAGRVAGPELAAATRSA